MSRHVLVVLTNPAEGREDEYNKWYDEVHLREVLGIDGCAAAQRFKLSEPQIMEDRSFSYLALYEIDAEDVGAALSALSAGAGTMEISGALGGEAKALAFSAIGERVEA